MQPKIESINLYTRGTWQVNADTQVYAEAGYSKRDTAFTLIPPSITPTIAFPPNAHQSKRRDQLRFGRRHHHRAGRQPSAKSVRRARARALPAFDVGASTRTANNEFNRIVLGIKGTAIGWDYDAGYTHSESKLHLDYSNMLNMAVVKDALGNPNSPYFPYYIGAQAGKNPASLYAAMVTNATSDSTTKLDIIDFKATRELMQLPGGAMGLAVGAEHRRDKLDNPSLSGTENGQINSSYVAAKGDSKVSAVYLEVLAPVIKTVELSGAVRYDKYDRFSSTTPKLGAKWTPLKTFALRGTYSEGFRAPGPAESNADSQSTGTSTVRDPIRCPNGTPLAGATSTDCAASVAAVKIGDPSLKPETIEGLHPGPGLGSVQRHQPVAGRLEDQA